MMAKITWVKTESVFKDVGDLHEATIENTGVTLVVRRTYGLWEVSWITEVRVGDPRYPGTGSAVTISHGASKTLEEAKLEALRLFRQWSMSVLFLAQTDGHGNYINIATGEKCRGLMVDVAALDPLLEEL